MISPVCICPGRPRDTLPGGTHRCPLPSAEMCFLGGSEEKSWPSWAAAARSLRGRFLFGNPDPQGGVSQSRTSKSRRARGMHRSECPRENREDTGDPALEENISEGHTALRTRDKPTVNRPSSRLPSVQLYTQSIGNHWSTDVGQSASRRYTCRQCSEGGLHGTESKLEGVTAHWTLRARAPGFCRQSTLSEARMWSMVMLRP